MDDYKSKYARGCEEMSLAEAAYRCGRSEDTIRAWIRGGHVKWGQYIPPENGIGNGQWVIRRRAFEAWCAGGIPDVKAEIIVDTPEAYDALCRVAIDRLVTKR